MLSEPSSGYLVDDTCFLGAEVLIDQTLPVVSSNLHAVESLHLVDWEISNFSKLEGPWVSEDFRVGGFKWNMKLDRRKTSVSLCLECVDAKSFASHEKIEAYTRIGFRNKLTGYDRAKRSRTHCFTSDCCTFAEDFFACPTPYDTLKRIMFDDCVFIEAEIAVRNVLSSLLIRCMVHREI